MTINVSATFNPDGWVTTIILEGLSTEDLPDAVRVLVKARQPRPHGDPAETVIMPLRTSVTAPATTSTYTYK